MDVKSVLKRIFHKKEEESPYPYEYFTINYSKVALESGYFDESLLEIEVVRGDSKVTYPYTKSLVQVLSKKMAFKNLSKEEIDLPTDYEDEPATITS